MPKESLPEREAERADVYETAGRYLEQLKPLLNEEARALEARGFLVHGDCRIAADRFEPLYSKDEITADAKKASEIEVAFPKDVPEKSIGDLLEVAKTLAINRLWFGRRLVVVRTSKFDDYVNGVDELVLDTKTREPVALVDDTTNVDAKLHELRDKVRRGTQVKYGLRLDAQGAAQKISYARLPILVLELHASEVLALAADLTKGKTSEETRKLGRTVAEHLEQESARLMEIVSPEQRLQYEKLLKIFRELAVL